MTPISPGKMLRDAVEESTIQVPGAFNALAARLIEQAGFDAAYLSGAAFRPARWRFRTSGCSR